MELTAAIKALEALSRPCAVDLYTDSQYVRLGRHALDQGLEDAGLEDRRPEAGQERGPLARPRRRAQRPRGDLALGPRPRRRPAQPPCRRARRRGDGAVPETARRQAGLSAATAKPLFRAETSANTSPGGRGRVRGADRVRGGPRDRRLGRLRWQRRDPSPGRLPPSRPLPPGEVGARRIPWA